MVGQVSFSIAYGVSTAPRNDPNIALAEAALEGVAVAQTKGRIFNLAPICKSKQSQLQFGPFFGRMLNALVQSCACHGGSQVVVLRKTLTRGNVKLTNAVMRYMELLRRHWYALCRTTTVLVRMFLSSD